MLRIGLTGGIGSGKSLVAKILETRNIPVFYSDKEANALVEKNAEVKSKIIDLLGAEAYNSSGYNRPYVAQRVFNSADLLGKLNQIIHPAVRQAFDHFVSSRNSTYVFNEAAIFFETSAHQSFDFMVLVCSPMELRIKRLQDRDKATVEEIKNRMDKQWSDEKKRPLADFIIENNENDSILEQIDELLKKLALISL
jgi:dephospho-CoA kinase